MTKSFTAKVLAVATLTSAMLFAPLQASAAQGGAGGGGATTTPTTTPTNGGGGKFGLGGGINCFANPVGVDPVTGATIFVTHCVKFP